MNPIVKDWALTALGYFVVGLIFFGVLRLLGVF